MPQNCTIFQIIKDESEFTRLKRSKGEEAGLANSCKDCNLQMNENKKKTLELRIFR